MNNNYRYFTQAEYSKSDMDDLRAKLEALEIERDDWQSLAQQITTHWIPANQALAARIKHLEDGLKLLSEGDTPWLDGYFSEAWEGMAKYAKQLLEQKAYAPYGRCDVCGTELEYEPHFKGAMDQPPSTGGYWCTQCEAWS